MSHAECRAVGGSTGKDWQRHTTPSGRIRSALIAVFVALVAAAAAPALAAAVTVSPLPGTPDASPQTQISILGTPAANITGVTVTGSETGVHEGQLEAYSTGSGASFVPNAPFLEGEAVSVTVQLGEGGPLSDSFTVAHTAAPQPFLTLSGEKPEEQQHFVSEPGIAPPKVAITKPDASLAGDIFLDPLPAPIIHPGGAKLLEFEQVGPNGLMILNPAGQLLWWRQLPENDAAGALELTSYEGKTALSWWQGRVTEVANGEGEGIIANTNYETIATVKAGNGYAEDIHEFNVTPEGTAYIDAYTAVCTPTCSEATPPVQEGVIQEIDIHTGLVMWEWHAMSEVPTSASEVIPSAGVFDAYHLNAVQLLPENKLLVSMRDTSAIYEIDKNTGAILWTLGGKKNQFKRSAGLEFFFQHDPKLEGKKLTLFGNEAGPPVHALSRGLILHLNIAAKKASLAREFKRPEKTLSPSEGSVQALKHGDVMVGFGATRYMAEFSSKTEGPGKKGTELFEAQLPLGDGTYRVQRYPWTATPNTLPAIAAVRESPTQVNVFASWNGATTVASWQVLAGASPSSLTPVAPVPWSGFETQIAVPGSATTFEVRALNSKGMVLATSEPVSAP
jgi:Arylsulfotransferase (ASST)